MTQSRAFAWLVFLAPFFYLSYGAANAIAARQHDVPSIVFAWEYQIPFVAWTIVPYWSINAFYAVSVFVCSTRQELDTHVRRLLTAQIVAVVCFILFPLQVIFHRPDIDGLAGLLFAALTSFDKPFNQAPSLHIALVIILYAMYANHMRGAGLWLLRLWFGLVALSVLTTYQHHFFDIPTGALLGCLCLWVWPDGRASPAKAIAMTRDGRRVLMAFRYLGGAAAAAAVALNAGGAALWSLWLSTSLLLVAVNYGLVGSEGFQKDGEGRMSAAARLILAPYLIAAFVNSRLWTLREPRAVAIGRGVWLGRIPLLHDQREFSAVVDTCAELPGGGTSAAWESIPMLDLVLPAPAQLREAAAIIERRRAAGPVLVCCALGYSRSAAAVATWLITDGAVRSVNDAINQIRAVRPSIVIDDPLRDAIAIAAGLHGSPG